MASTWQRFWIVLNILSVVGLCIYIIFFIVVIITKMPTETKIIKRCQMELYLAKRDAATYGKMFESRRPDCTRIDWFGSTPKALYDTAICNIEINIPKHCNQELQNLKKDQYNFVFVIVLYKILIPLIIIILEVIIWIKLKVFEKWN